MTRVENWFSVMQGEKGREVLFFLSFTFLLIPPPASKTCNLEAKQIKKQKTKLICKCPNSVHLESIVEKEEKNDKLKIGKASSWVLILLLSFHLFFLIFFLLVLLFDIFLLVPRCLVFNGQMPQFLNHLICTLNVTCVKVIKCAIKSEARNQTHKPCSKFPPKTELTELVPNSDIKTNVAEHTSTGLLVKPAVLCSAFM